MYILCRRCNDRYDYLETNAPDREFGVCQPCLEFLLELEVRKPLPARARSKIIRKEKDDGLPPPDVQPAD